MIDFLSSAFLPLFIAGILICGYIKKVNIYDSFVEGAKEGPITTLRIFPGMVAMFCAVNVLNASGIVEFICSISSRVLSFVNFDSNLIPIIILRPISGSGAYAVLSNIYKTLGTDSFVGLCASVMCGCTETTFYVISTYFSGCGIKNMRFAVKAALLADLLGFIFAYILSLIFFK